jgi:DNA-binding CsgD family transcriptional regulator
VASPLPRQRTRQREGRAAVRIAIRVADPVLRERIALALGAAGDFAADERGSADVTIADHAIDVAGPVIALASAEEAAAWRSDVRAVLPPDVAPMLLVAAITLIAAGFTIAPALASPDQAATGRWAEGFDPDGAEEDEADHGASVALTAREREVLALLAAGASNKAIARALDVSVHTAKFHVASLAEKLGASTRLEAVAIALRTGLIMV